SKLLRWGLAQQEDGTLTLSGIAGASSYLDWIAPLVSKSLEQSLQAHQQALESQQEQQAQLAQEDQEDQEDQRLQSQQEQHERHQQDQFTKRDLAQARRCYSPIGWIV